MNKALSTLGICACARKISYGETLIKEIKSKKVVTININADSTLVVFEVVFQIKTATNAIAEKIIKISIIYQVL